MLAYRQKNRKTSLPENEPEEMSYLVGGQWVCGWPGAARNMAGARRGDFYWPGAGWKEIKEIVFGGEL